MFRKLKLIHNIKTSENWLDENNEIIVIYAKSFLDTYNDSIYSEKFKNYVLKMCYTNMNWLSKLLVRHKYNFKE